MPWKAPGQTYWRIVCRVAGKHFWVLAILLFCRSRWMICKELSQGWYNWVPYWMGQSSFQSRDRSEWNNYLDWMSLFWFTWQLNLSCVGGIPPWSRWSHDSITRAIKCEVVLRRWCSVKYTTLPQLVWKADTPTSVLRLSKLAATLIREIFVWFTEAFQGLSCLACLRMKVVQMIGTDQYASPAFFRSS